MFQRTGVVDAIMEKPDVPVMRAVRLLAGAAGVNRVDRPGVGTATKEGVIKVSPGACLTAGSFKLTEVLTHCFDQL